VVGPRGEGGGDRSVGYRDVTGWWWLVSGPFFRGWAKVKNGARDGIGEKMQDDESGVAESDGDWRNLLQRS
jgi:hypothetical protein